MKTITVTKTFSQDEPGDVRVEKRIIRSDDGSEIITLNGPEDIDASVNEHKIVVRATNSDKPMIIVDGKVMELGYDVNAINPEDIVTVEVFKDGDVVKTYGAEAKNGVVKINTKKIKAIRAEAMEEGRKAMEEGREEMRVEMKRAKEEMRKARAEMDAQQPELEKARQEMLKAKEEMLKAKAEMEKAKAEFEKAKANLKKG
jgi:outer membrane receptor for ferrienterochelin and colicin